MASGDHGDGLPAGPVMAASWQVTVFLGGLGVILGLVVSVPR
jgi:hypothetical protein